MTFQSVHQFAEKVALITDGLNPLGRAVALQLALQGSFVIVAFANAAAEATRSIEELRSLGTLAGAFEADISTEAGAELAIDEVERTFGRLDLLVNCLKYAPQSSFQEKTSGNAMSAGAVEARAAGLLIESGRKLLDARPKPKVVNVAWSPTDREIQINAKSGPSYMVELTAKLAKTLPRNFRVNCVVVDETSDLPFPGELIRPPGSVSPDDAARVITFLLSSEAIALNGQALKLG